MTGAPERSGKHGSMRYLQAWIVSRVASGGVAMLAPAQAHAQAAQAEAAPKLWLGGHLGLSPLGTLQADVAGTPLSADTAVAFEIGGRFEVQVMPLLSIGIAPAILFHIQGKADTDSATALDLPLRITAGGDVAPRIRRYGFAAPATRSCSRRPCSCHPARRATRATHRAS